VYGLFFRLQVEKRALEVWGTEEALEDEHLKRDLNRDKVIIHPTGKYYFQGIP
jgi:hypothetical protein